MMQAQTFARGVPRPSYSRKEPGMKATIKDVCEGGGGVALYGQPGAA